MPCVCTKPPGNAAHRSTVWNKRVGCAYNPDFARNVYRAPYFAHKLDKLTKAHFGYFWARSKVTRSYCTMLVKNTEASRALTLHTMDFARVAAVIYSSTCAASEPLFARAQKGAKNALSGILFKFLQYRAHVLRLCSSWIIHVRPTRLFPTALRCAAFPGGLVPTHD